MPRRATRVPTKVVRLEIFDVHGHNAHGPLDYRSFFSQLAGLNSQQRRVNVAHRVIAVPTLSETAGVFTFSAYVGSPDSSFLVLDLNDDTEEVRQLEPGELLATRTIGVIDAINRIAIIQHVRGGVRAAQIATLFEKVAHQLLPHFALGTLEFALRAGPSFLQQIDALTRIQSASVTLTRPNIDWTDFSDAVNGFAGDSNARNIQVAASAPRDESLRKDGGIVGLITGLSKAKIKSVMKAAVVRGTTGDSGLPVEVKLKKNIQSKKVRVPEDGGLPNPNAVQMAATDVLRQLNADTN